MTADVVPCAAVPHATRPQLDWSAAAQPKFSFECITITLDLGQGPLIRHVGEQVHRIGPAALHQVNSAFTKGFGILLTLSPLFVKT